MPLEIPSISKEYVKIPITGPSDLAELDVNLAILPQGQDPADEDWNEGVWVGRLASLLIGPGSTFGALTKGVTYGIWVQIVSDVEQPVLGPYPLHIT